ncbi:MAG: class I SAM-dependent methyltransferase [Gemmataceae bacterium]|nr:class I SAM-dependent methyltransferase [Gemmataceae bacterium]
MPHPLAAVRGLVPRAVRRAGKDIIDRLRLWADWATNTRLPLDPPAELVTGIGGSWESGRRYLHLFRELCDLRPDEAVLDVGCGVGRMALPLAGYLTHRGRYDGFDIVRPNVRWCRRAITPRWPNFRFQHADIYNREYNPDGRRTARTFRFPYPDASFDFAFLTSVFTHLLPEDAAHYLAELGRVLKPGGRCLATFNLLNAEADALIDAGKCRHVMLPREGVYRVHSREVPEACIALDEGFVTDAARSAGLDVVPPIRYGLWCGRENGFEFQDIVVLRKSR